MFKKRAKLYIGYFYLQGEVPDMFWAKVDLFEAKEQDLYLVEHFFNFHRVIKAKRFLQSIIEIPFVSICVSIFIQNLNISNGWIDVNLIDDSISE